MFFSSTKENLITVPSCNEHNSNKNGDDEYMRNIFILHNNGQGNEIDLLRDKTIRSFERSPKFLTNTFKKIGLIENTNRGWFEIDTARVDRWIKSLSYAIYRHDFKQNYLGDWYIIDDASAVVKNGEYQELDREADRRDLVRQNEYKEIECFNPDTFKYFRYEENNKIRYKFVFYNEIVFYSYTRKNRSCPYKMI